MKTFFQTADEDRAKAVTNAFIQRINADYDDVISVPRSVAVLVRDEIWRLRRKAKEEQHGEDCA